MKNVSKKTKTLCDRCHKPKREQEYVGYSASRLSWSGCLEDILGLRRTRKWNETTNDLFCRSTTG
jgi:hypothetical protein